MLVGYFKQENNNIRLFSSMIVNENGIIELISSNCINFMGIDSRKINKRKIFVSDFIENYNSDKE